MSEFIRNSSVAVGTTNVLVSPERVQEEGIRKELIIVNTSTAGQNITLSMDAYAVAGAGIFLTPYSTYYASASGDFTITSKAIYAIGSAVSGTIAIYERVIV